MFYVIPHLMEVFLEMRSGFRNVEEKVRVWKENIHSLKFTPITADSYVMLYEQALSGIDVLDMDSSILIEKYQENCSLLVFLAPLTEFLEKSYMEILDTALYCPYASDLDDRASRECGQRWGDLFRKLEACRARLLFSLSRLNMACSLPPTPGTKKEQKQTEKLNKQIVFCNAFFAQFPWYASLTKKEVACIIKFILQCTEDYVCKTLSSCREDYQGNVLKYSGGKHNEEATIAAKKIHQKINLKGK